jgi:hypothetical protein
VSDGGVEIPKGDPDALVAAAGAWKGLGGLLDQHVGAMRGAAGTVVGADWHGNASLAYQSTSMSYGFEMGDVAGALDEAAHAARAFARVLEVSQKRAKRARERAIDALAAIKTAKAQLADASERVLSAQSRASVASDSMFRAAAAGPAGEGLRAAAQADYDSAVREASDAAGDVRRAQDALTEAERELREARRDGREANEDADDAARTAGAAFSSAAGSARPPTILGPAAVPVSLRGARPELAPLGAGAIGGAGARPSWLSGPGRYSTPAQARAAQIARLQAEADDAAANQREPLNPLQKLGSAMMTAGASVADVPTFGYTSKALEWAAGDDRAVDQDAGFYKGAQKVTEVGEMLTMVGIVRHGGKHAVEEFLEHAAKRGDDAPKPVPKRGGGGHGPGPNPYPHLAPGERWTPDQGIPVLGRLDDTEVAKDWPGHAVLDLEDWNPAKNEDWIQSIIDQKGPVYIGSPIEGNMWNPRRNSPTIFADELEWLGNAGYRREGDFMIPPP